jgi:hypothetical protein
MNLKNQRPVLIPTTCQPEIESMSKAALMDMVWSFATRCVGVETPTQTNGWDRVYQKAAA